MGVTKCLEMAVIVGAMVYKCSCLLTNGQDANQSPFSVGYLFACTICLATLSLCCGEKMRHTRRHVGGSIYAWLIPVVNLEKFLHTPTTPFSWHDEYALVIVDQVQLAAILVVSLSTQMSWPTWILPFTLLPMGTLWIFYTPLGVEEQVAATASYAIFLWLICNLFHIFPQTFSFGEGLIVSQAGSQVSFYLLGWLMRTGSTSGAEQSPYDFISAILTTSLTIAAVVYILLLTGCGGSTYYFVSCVGLTTALLLSIFTGHVQEIVAEIFSSTTMIVLIIWWMLVVSAALGTVILYNKQGWKVTTVDRKYFHIMAIMIFMPGVVFSPHLTRLASVVALLLFLTLEFVRFMNLPYLGMMLDGSLSTFLDGRQDTGCLILTHIYLLSGCALPLWLTASSQLSGQHLSLYSGIISLGVGDSCASVFGSRFGRLAYPGSRKTLEGTLAAWLSMLAFSSSIAWPSVAGAGQLAWMLLLIAVLESCTLQVDNLILPLFTFVLLSGSNFSPVGT